MGQNSGKRDRLGPNSGLFAENCLHAKIQYVETLFSYDLIKTSQVLRMLSSVTINCQVTKIVMNPGSRKVLKSHESLGSL